jgi:hypothetical protein
MADAYICRRGGSGSGGGSELVIVGGTTSPAKVNHNTIWLNTPNTITSCVLSDTQPTGPVEGMVWITIGASGGCKMTSPVGGDWITVYPISAKQYVGGVWTDVTAKSYQDGVWVEWFDTEKYLFYYSREKYKWQGRAWAALEGTGAEVPTVTTNADGSKSISFSNSAAAYRGCAYELEKDVDLTNISTITASVDFHISDDAKNGNMYLIAINRSKTYWIDNTAAQVYIENGDNQTVTLDVSKLTGNYNIAITMYINNNAVARNATTTLREIKME